MATIHDVIVPAEFFNNHVTSASKVQLSADDRLDILDLVNRFEWSFDARRFDALEEILTEDAVIDHIFGFRKGKKACIDMLRGTVPGYGLRHQGINASIFINDKDEIAVLSFLNVVQVTDEGIGLQPPVILGHAVVTDVVRKENDTWKIVSRTFEQMKVPDVYLPDETARKAIEKTAAERAAEKKG
jgi:hypothetical protein